MDMDPYKLYTLTATAHTEIANLWNNLRITRYAMLYEIEDELNYLFVSRKYVHVDASGAMTFRWPARDGSTIIASPSAFKTWFFTGVQEVTQLSPRGRPGTPLEPILEEHPKIDVDDLLERFEATPNND